MDFIKTRHLATTVRAVLLATLVLSAPVFAASNPGEATLAHNEHAAQNAIASTPDATREATSAETRVASLADNEQAARGAILGADIARGAIAGTMGEATLLHNEYAARRAIVDSHGVDTVAGTTIVNAALVTAAVRPVASR